MKTTDQEVSILKEYYADIEMPRAYTIIKYLEEACPCVDDSMVVYAVGNCHKSKAEINSVSNLLNVEVKVDFPMRKGILSLLPIPTPRSFCIKISDCNCMVDLFSYLNEYLFIEYLFFDRSMENGLIDKVRLDEDYYGIVKKSGKYLIYGVDCDNEESSTGVMEFVSIGEKFPKKLISFI